MATQQLQQRLRSVIERMQYVNQIISTLSNKDAMSSKDVVNTNRRLLYEVHRYVMLTNELKLDFVKYVVEDAKRVQALAQRNPARYDEYCWKLEQLESIFDEIVNHENEDIDYSKIGIKDAKDAKKLVRQIRRYIENEIGPEAERQSRRDGADRSFRAPM